MKKTLALILALVLTFSFAACSENNDENDKTTNSASNVTETDKDISSGSEAEASAEETEEASKPEEVKPEGEKEPSKNEEASKPADKPQDKPQEKPQDKPQANAPKTIGNALLADFKAKAASGDALSVAKALLKNEVIIFNGDAVNVEPGFLTGFGNSEISGFKDAAMFLPIIGTIPFVGYVFELENGASTADFISTLKSNANMRWNVCSEADEMVTGSAGNKVFFVMCRNSEE